MPQIKFSHHWTKLDCPKGSLFTTIRSDHGNKAQYYMNLEGQSFEVVENGKVLFNATLLQVFRGSGKDLSGSLLYYDTDGNGEWIDKLQQTYRVLVLLFRRTD